MKDLYRHTLLSVVRTSRRFDALEPPRTIVQRVAIVTKHAMYVLIYVHAHTGKPSLRACANTRVKVHLVYTWSATSSMFMSCRSLASQPYFPPCAHARVISGWGERREVFSPSLAPPTNHTRMRTRGKYGWLARLELPVRELL